uniref:Uncharacterized protein n=1 Tax=Anguilla anguilla TaxID=7936 RepID=A0A0E9QS33_ANGAN
MRGEAQHWFAPLSLLSGTVLFFYSCERERFCTINMADGG